MAKLNEERGELVGALIVEESDEVLVVMQSGKVVRSAVSQVPSKGRDTMGVIFAKPGKKDHIIAVAKNSEEELEENLEESAVPLNPENTTTESSEDDHTPTEGTADESTDGGNA
ncbi:DNA gyrase C-terminal beta-propeller domain-containing protein [Arthrobacter sp. JCM 19049]|uniref:DNA gyrase C-terminal beta-propeller domain-containing protein n=1 Tax=Arthrobacter sp. JCM 19049 TaxID=1460643 RepID=UPI000B1F71CF|nr:DNA gyrase C-terminal beta-propeller domain-containing protein [Arthrobacter sp. JCM 19049]